MIIFVNIQLGNHVRPQSILYLGSSHLENPVGPLLPVSNTPTIGVISRSQTSTVQRGANRVEEVKEE